MQRRGFTRIANYLDDFICVGDTREECGLMQRVLIHLLHGLGFIVAWHKCSSPNQVTCYLGIDFDSVLMQLRMPLDKMGKMYHELSLSLS